MNETQQAQPAAPAARSRAVKMRRGVVIRDKAAKTRTVEVSRLVLHPKYHKYIRRRSRFHVHDEKNESRVGDVVEIRETRPLSRLKRWKLIRVVVKGKRI